MRPEHLEYLKAVAEERDGIEPWQSWWEANEQALQQELPIGQFFRLKYGRRLAAGEILERHGGSYTPPPMPEPEPFAPGSCPLCGGPITDQMRVGGGHGPGIRLAWFGGKCRGCDVDFRMTCFCGEQTPWCLDAPEPDELVAPLTLEEAEALGRGIREYPRLYERWQEFLSRSRPGDEYWRYRRPDLPELPAPVARVRAGTPVAWFRPGDNLLLANGHGY